MRLAIKPLRCNILGGLFFGCWLAAGLTPSAWAAGPVALVHARIAGVAVTYVAVRLSDPRIRVRVEVCRGFPHGDEPFPAMIGRLKPLAAVDGAYFSKATRAPIGDIVIDGQLVHRGQMGTALALGPGRTPSIRRVVWGHAADWSGFETVLACGPALVLQGVVDVQPEREGFHDPHILGTTPRMAVGYTADRHLVLVQMSAVTFAREALVMKSLGCVGAMNLDAGASTAMYFRGKFLATPSRRLTNILCVYGDG